MNKQEDFKMIRMATENDILSIRALITSVPGLWHDEWRSDALEHALQSANGLAFVWGVRRLFLVLAAPTI
jgi:hypothetical protein